MLDVIGGGRGADSSHRLNGRHALRCRQYRSTPKAVSDYNAGRLILFRKKVGCRQQILYVGGKTGITEIAVTVAEPGKVETQYADAILCEGTSYSRRSGDVLATGEAVCKQGHGAGLLLARQFQQADQYLTPCACKFYFGSRHDSFPFPVDWSFFTRPKEGTNCYTESHPVFLANLLPGQIEPC